MVARFVRIEEVRGSIPRSSTIFAQVTGPGSISICQFARCAPPLRVDPQWVSVRAGAANVFSPNSNFIAGGYDLNNYNQTIGAMGVHVASPTERSRS